MNISKGDESGSSFRSSEKYLFVSAIVYYIHKYAPLNLE